jgi:galactitol-specific phosphotransferase system IIB component
MNHKLVVLVVCGSGIATANMIAGRFKELYRASKITVPVEIYTTRAHSFILEFRLKRPNIVIAAAFVTDKKTMEEVGNTPIYEGMAFLTGIGEKDLFDRIIRELQAAQQSS